jgi:membrane peptidoglycan carboxypeptidase
VKSGFFGVPETATWAGQDPRSLKVLLLGGAEAGDASAWAVLVQRMAPALTHAPQPFITAGQGSEAGDGRKGVRRTPKSALAALALVYTATSGPGVSRALLLAFAKAVLEHPDATQPPEVEDGKSLICYGEQHWVEGRTPITAGMAIASAVLNPRRSFRTRCVGGCVAGIRET